jgi:hypothetical protein
MLQILITYNLPCIRRILVNDVSYKKIQVLRFGEVNLLSLQPLKILLFF